MLDQLTAAPNAFWVVNNTRNVAIKFCPSADQLLNCVGLLLSQGDISNSNDGVYSVLN